MACFKFLLSFAVYQLRSLLTTRKGLTVNLQLAVVAALSGLGQTASAQAPVDPLAGILPFSTQNLGVDLASSQVHQQILIRGKNGLAPFAYNLIGNWRIYKYNDAGTWMWEANTGFGLQGLPSGLAGSHIGLNTSTGTSCPAGPIYSNITVNDPSGAAHSFPTSFTINTCSTASLNAVATTDGSGYTLVIPNQENGPWWIYDKSGNYANVQTTFPSAVYTADGALVESNTDDGFGTFTDSLDEQVLTATPGSEHRVTNGTFTYADASGTQQTYTMNMAQYNFASAFGCAGISEYQTSPQTGLYLGGGRYGSQRWRLQNFLLLEQSAGKHNLPNRRLHFLFLCWRNKRHQLQFRSGSYADGYGERQQWKQ